MGPFNDKQFLSDIGSNASDLLQSASNAVASNVTGPVDIISLILKKVGVPVGDSPIGGSENFKQLGLLREVSQSPSSIVGETLGLLGPIVATSKSPEIARGLLQVADNASAPSKLVSQSGVIKFPESFSKSDKSNAVKASAESLANTLREKGFQATVEHSGSAAGPSSYVRVFDPQTGRFIVDPIRISDHSKGPVNSQFVNEIGGEFPQIDFSKAIQLAEDMRAQGPGKLMMAQLERMSKKSKK